MQDMRNEASAVSVEIVSSEAMHEVHQHRLIGDLLAHSMSLIGIYSGIAGLFGLLAMFVHYRVVPAGSLFDNWPWLLTALWVLSVVVAVLSMVAAASLIVSHVRFARGSLLPWDLHAYWRSLCEFHGGMSGLEWGLCIAINVGLVYYLPEAILGCLALMAYMGFQSVSGGALRQLGSYLGGPGDDF
jgi:hypothetical protein